MDQGNPLWTKPIKIRKPNEKETTIERGSPLNSEIPEWLQEFRENLVDGEIPVQGDFHASSRMLDFGQFDFGQLAEVEIGRSRNWPKSTTFGREHTTHQQTHNTRALSI